MSAEELIRKYVFDMKIMQLATCTKDQPWVCNLHYYSDDELNIYWLSTPDRRHSKELEENPKAGAAILVHQDSEDEDYVIGLSVEGVAEKVDWHKYEQIVPNYGRKHGTSKTFLDSIIAGENAHIIYVLKPTKIVLFDNKNFPDNPRQEWNVK